MKKTLALLCTAALAVVAVPAIAKTDKADKAKSQPRWAHSYASAIEESRERGCFLLATFHIEH
jgi:hypothetical protein